MFEAARDRVGTSFELLVEGHGRWDVNMGIRICRRPRTDRRAVWAEDICQPDSAEDLGLAGAGDPGPSGGKRKVDIALCLPRGPAPAGGPYCPGRPGLDRRCDSAEARRVADLAEIVPPAVRSPRLHRSGYRAGSTLHLATAQPNCLGVEVVRGFINGYYHEVLDKPISIDHGQLAAPTGPGLGAALSSEFLGRGDVNIVSSR